MAYRLDLQMTNSRTIQPYSLAWVRAIRMIDRLNYILASKEFGPDGEKSRRAINDQIFRLREMTAIRTTQRETLAPGSEAVSNPLRHGGARQ